MRVLFYWYDHDSDRLIFEALGRAMRSEGDAVHVIPKQEFKPEQLAGFDAVFTRGISEISRMIMDSCLEKGVSVIYCDKGYVNRGWNNESAYYRFSVNGFHPLHYFQRTPRPPDRWEKLGVTLAPRQQNGQAIVFAGIPQKSADWHGFDSVRFAEDTIQKIQSLTDRPVIYRPRKTNNPPPPIPGTTYSHNRCGIQQELKNAFALVTYASNAAVDAILAGVPAFVLGPGIAKPVSNTDLRVIQTPLFPSEKERAQWCWDLAYCQWTLQEMENGLLWGELKNKMLRPEFA